MMTAMMLPSATPVILLYSHILSRGHHKDSIAHVLFAVGYLTVWACFSLVAVFIHFLMEWTGFLSSMMKATSTALSGALLLAAGIYQLTPVKYACLHACRTPLDFLILHWHVGAIGAVKMGIRHGSYCVACCWALMLLLFVAEVMNLFWITGVAVYVFVEKLVPSGRIIPATVGALLIVAGAYLLATSFEINDSLSLFKEHKKNHFKPTKGFIMPPCHANAIGCFLIISNKWI